VISVHRAASTRLLLISSGILFGLPCRLLCLSQISFRRGPLSFQGRLLSLNGRFLSHQQRNGEPATTDDTGPEHHKADCSDGYNETSGSAKESGGAHFIG
jgi:hypothetical protein